MMHFNSFVKNTGLLFALLCSGLSVHAIEITGAVIDKKTKEPIIGATIIIQSTPVGSTSDIDGRFSLHTDREFPIRLEISYLGYITQEIELDEARDNLSVFLEEDVKQLDEIVVIGYGVQRRRELTGSVASVDKTVLQQSAVSLDALLGGAVAGVNVTQVSGQPGAGTSIRIRGGTSINAGNEPLYVIDGMIFNHGAGSTKTITGNTAGVVQGTIESSINPLSAINPSDIESIEILKDVSATAIFGSRGANGVILVTTKKGERGKNTVHYTLSTGWSSPAKYLKMMDARQWSKLQIDYFGNKGNLTPDQIDRLGKGYDWQRAVLQTGFTQNHELSVIGGDEKTKYLVSGNYLNQEGIVLNSGFNRYNLRINIDRDVNKNLTIGASSAFGKSTQNSLSTTTQPSGANSTPFQDGITNSLTYALLMPPTVPIYHPDGSYNYSNPWESSHFSLNDKQVNPVSDLNNSVAQSVNQSLLANFYARYAIINGLEAKVTLSTDQSNITQNYFAPSSSALGLAEVGVGSIGKRQQEVWQTDATLEYSKRFNPTHFINVLGGYTWQNTQFNYQTTTASHFINETLKHNNLADGEIDYDPVTGFQESTLKSIIARVNYSLFERYHLTATYRADHSSRFAAGNEWGYFPSVGLSWNVNDEPFWKKQPVLSALKLRLTGGTVGNQEIDNQLFSQLYGAASYGGHTVYQMYNVGNDDLKWETTDQYNAGIDAGFFNNRANLVLDVYYRKTHDLLLIFPTPLGSAVPEQMANIGTVTNKGVEAGIHAVLIKNKNFDWNVSANVAHNINKIVYLGEANNKYMGEYSERIYREGESLGSFIGLVFDGVVQAGEDPSSLPHLGGAPTQAGNPKFVDINKDENIDLNDRVVLGSTQPDFTFGISSSLAYRHFDLFISFQGSQGNEVFNSLRKNLERPNSSYNVSASLVDAWTPDRPSNEIPAISVALSSKYIDTRYVEDGSYLRLKNISLGYRVKLKGTSADARFFVSAQNLFTLTGYKGYDPEVENGIDIGAYPAARTFTAGIGLTFN